MTKPKRYGLPYMGSKSRIAEKIINLLPSGDTFVDLFAGGCAITHAALLSGKWRNFICNDITDAPKLFTDAIAGKYHNESRWISRDDFFRLKDTDAYVRLCWSFGNNQKEYLYSKEIEPYKRALHYAHFFCDSVPFRELGVVLPPLLVKSAPSNAKYQRLKACIKKQIGRFELQSLERLQRLQSLESLERLQSL